jgi:hypothetical protein
MCDSWHPPSPPAPAPARHRRVQCCSGRNYPHRRNVILHDHRRHPPQPRRRPPAPPPGPLCAVQPPPSPPTPTPRMPTPPCATLPLAPPAQQNGAELPPTPTGAQPHTPRRCPRHRIPLTAATRRGRARQTRREREMRAQGEVHLPRRAALPAVGARVRGCSGRAQARVRGRKEWGRGQGAGEGGKNRGRERARSQARGACST